MAKGQGGVTGDIAHAPGPLWRSSCFPAELYPPQRRLDFNSDMCLGQELIVNYPGDLL